MTTLSEKTLTLRGRRVAPASLYPAMREVVKTRIGADLRPDDELFVNFGAIDSPLPHTMFDSYDSAPEELNFRCFVLENRYLRAEFLPEVGGRLWRLWDKEKARDIIYYNPEFLPCNLAIRNAWVAGGIEYNFGRRGHDAQTSDSRFAARVVAADGTPILRFYEFNRDRAVPFQMDFYLPENSRFLYNVVRVVNPHAETIPMYYWANIALAETPDCRVLVRAHDAYTNNYNEGHHQLAHVALPDGEGFDATFPARFPHARDHFYRLDPGERELETVAYAGDRLFVFASTARLVGRKLLVWGGNTGGRHWQKKLVGAGCEPYIEIQGGYTHTQMESRPMPPSTVWEHVEAYGEVSADYSALSGDFESASLLARETVYQALPESELDKVLNLARADFLTKPGQVLHRGSGWGALEVYRRSHGDPGKFWPDHLDFGDLGAEQEAWRRLFDGEKIGEIRNGCYMVHPAMREAIFADPDQKLHRALNYFYLGDYPAALNALGAVPADDALALYVRGEIEFAAGQLPEAMADIFAAAAVDLTDPFLIKEALKLLVAGKDWARGAELYRKLPPKLAALPMVKFLYAAILTGQDKLDEAEEVLLADGGLDIPDIREGENSLSHLYLEIQRRRGIDPENCPVPPQLDLRMRV